MFSLHCESCAFCSVGSLSVIPVRWPHSVARGQKSTTVLVFFSGSVLHGPLDRENEGEEGGRERRKEERGKEEKKENITELLHWRMSSTWGAFADVPNSLLSCLYKGSPAQKGPTDKKNYCSGSFSAGHTILLYTRQYYVSTNKKLFSIIFDPLYLLETHNIPATKLHFYCRSLCFCDGERSLRAVIKLVYVIS